MNTTRGFISLGLILVLIIVAAVLGGGAYYYANPPLVPPGPGPVETASTTTPTPASPNPIVCKVGQHSNGVRCVPNSNTCPVYNACPPGYTSNTSVDANGCTKLQCTAPDNATSFSATPTSGSAPLTVQFSHTYRIPGNISIDYGDGTSCSTADPNCMYLYTHIYSSSGTYSAKLMKSVSHCVSNGGNPVYYNCGPDTQETIGTTTITVK